MSNQQPTIEKKIIHINKSFGNVETNLNSKITYNLKDPLHLRRNDTVSLVKAMVGERGLTADTIAFTEIQRITFKGFIYTQANSRKYGNFGSDKHLIQEFGYWPDAHVPGLVNDIEDYGPTNAPIFLVRIIPELKSGGNASNPDDYNYWVLPETVEKTVVINPGNYTVSALAQEFEIQLTGQQYESDTFRNFLINLQDKNEGFGGNFFDNEWLLGKLSYKSIYPLPEFSDQSNYQNLGSFLCRFLDATESPSEGYCFLDGKSFQNVVEEGRSTGRLKDINIITLFVPPGENGYVYYGLSQGPVSGSNNTPENPANIMKYNIYGASEFQLIYDTETVNRFSISNLHTPLKVPNYTDYNTSNPQAGQQITKFDARDRNGDQDNTQKGFYPLETSSGFIGLSFDYEAVKKTPIYLANSSVLTEDINDIIKDAGKTKSYFIMNTYRHYEYYPNDTVPEDTFDGSFWDRLGFGIAQLYNFGVNIEQYYRLKPTDLVTLDKYQMWGIITHNDSGYSMATSAGGMGQPIVTNDGVPFQPYSTFGVLTVNPITGQPRVNTEFNILTTSKYLTAEKYPDLLAGKNYYIIKSNIIQNNYYDVKSNKSSIIGLINFNFVSNDTIFSTEGIEFPITQDTILNEITMELTNPDGSPVSEQILGKNSGFLVQIVRNLDIDLEVQQLENKPVKKE